MDEGQRKSVKIDRDSFASFFRDTEEEAERVNHEYR